MSNKLAIPVDLTEMSYEIFVLFVAEYKYSFVK